jgi:hypothetical protein
MLDVRCEMTASLVHIIAIPLQIFVRLNARSYSTLYNQAMPWFWHYTALPRPCLEPLESSDITRETEAKRRRRFNHSHTGMHTIDLCGYVSALPTCARAYDGTCRPVNLPLHYRADKITEQFRL